MLDRISGFYVFQMYMPCKDAWLDVREFSDFVEGSKWVDAARCLDSESQFRLIRVML